MVANDATLSMPMNATTGTLAQLLEMTEVELRPVVERLRAVVLEVHPEAFEVVRLGDRAVTFGVGPRKTIDGYAYVLPYKGWVNIGFYHSTDLPDPMHRLEGTGASMRHVKVRSVDDADAPEIRALIEAALHERRTALG